MSKYHRHSKHHRHYKHLHVPDTWEQYWSKYPNGYTMLESLIDWVSQTNKMISSFNNLSDEYTTLNRNMRALEKELRASWKGYKEHTEKTYADFRDEILTMFNQWVATIEPTIQDEVVSSLTSWLDNGTLADIINEDVFNMKANQEDLEATNKRLDVFNRELQQIVLNGADFGLTGDESFNATETMVSFFDYAKEVNADVVIIPEGTHILDGSNVRYENDNSTIIFEGVIKLNDYGTQTSGSIINFRADNLLLKNFKVDGDRANNVINTEARGTQFNFASYVRNNIVFEGGWSKNALQSSFQSSSNMVFKDFEFRDAGEHHAYLTANEGVDAHDYMIFENCEFYNWAIDTSGGAISGRDYYSIQGRNLRMAIEDGVQTDSAYYISSRTHRDTIGNPKDKRHVYEQIHCTGSNYIRSISSADPIPLTIRDSYIEGYIASRNDSDSLIVENTEIVMNNAYATTPEIADKYFNCKFYGGRLWPEHRFEMYNCEVYCNENTNAPFLSLNPIPKGENSVIDNVTFLNFADYHEESTILNSKSSGGGNRNIITNNRYVNCGTMRGIGRISMLDIVNNNHDMDDSGVVMIGDARNTNVNNNTLIDNRE